MTKDLIQKLTSETMEGVSGSEQAESGDLDFYFEKKSKSDDLEHPAYVNTENVLAFLDKHQVTLFLGDWVKSLQCLRFLINGKTLDFPITWSFFEILSQKNIQRSSDFAIIIDANNDSLHLLQILEALGLTVSSILFYLEKGTVYLVLFKEIEKGILSMIKENHLSNAMIYQKSA